MLKSSFPFKDPEQALMTDAATDANEHARQTVRRFHFVFLIQAALLIVAGVVAIISPFFATVLLTLILGWTLLFTGVVQAISLLFGRSHHFWPQLISAVLAFFIGLIIIRNPDVAVISLVLVFIVYFMIEGISKIIFALTVRPLKNWFWVLLSGVVGVLLSLWLFANPMMSVFVLGIFIGIQLIVEGFAVGSMAWSARNDDSV